MQMPSLSASFLARLLAAGPPLPHVLVMPGTRASHTVDCTVFETAPVCFMVASQKPSPPPYSKSILLPCLVFIPSCGYLWHYICEWTSDVYLKHVFIHSADTD